MSSTTGSTEGLSALSLVNPQDDSFKTKGTLDWVGLTSKTVSFSVDVLSRCAAAGVDPYTLVIGQAVAQSLPLATCGLLNVQEAMAGLKSFAGLGGVLWFGFGIKSIVWTLAMTVQGCSLMALCAALSECFHEDFAALVLHNIVLLHNPSEQLTPSLQQWLSIIRACAGIFSTTKFPRLAEGFMRLGPDLPSWQDLCSKLGKRPAYERWPSSLYRGSPSEEDLADAIMGIGKVATREYDSIAICGSTAAVGWLAAVAEWLYDLPFTIKDMEGRILHSNCTASQEARIQIVFRSLIEESRNVEDVVAKIVSKTYELHHSLDIFNLGESQSQLNPAVLPSGRLPWESCLASVFGYRVTELLSVGKHVGIAVGCAATIFKEIAFNKVRHVVDSNECSRGSCCCRSNFLASSGQGFIHTVFHWFPELEAVRTHVDKGLHMAWEDARDLYGKSVKEIQSCCAASDQRCYGDSCREDALRENVSDSHGQAYCLLVMFETILVLCRILSGVKVTVNLLPTLAGIEMLYRKRRDYRRRAKESIRDDDYMYQLFDPLAKLLGPIRFVLEGDRMLHGGVDACQGNNFKWRMTGALELFTGRSINSVSSNTTALCENGICAYPGILTEFSLDSELVGLVNIVPGQIERGHKPYRVLRDQDTRRPTESCGLMPLLQRKYSFDGVSILLTETVKALSMSFKFHDRGLKAGKTVQIGPILLTNTISYARELVDHSSACCSHHEAPNNSHEVVWKLEWRSKRFYVIDCRGYDDHLMAVVMTTAQKDRAVLKDLNVDIADLEVPEDYWDVKDSTFLCDDPCLGCFLDHLTIPLHGPNYSAAKGPLIVFRR